MSQRLRALRRFAPLLVALAVLLSATVAVAQGGTDPLGQNVEYRDLFDRTGKLGFLTPRVVVWIFAQLHLLFAAFVLAVPMFVVIIEVVGHLTKDKEQSKKYNSLAYEFCRLLTTSFSITSILGAVLTFACIFLYPKFFNYLANVFGPTMYLYACIFFGESFSLYLYYYGWKKFKKGIHVALGLCLNVFGVTLMLIANAWTTFMMAPAGVGPDGAVLDRHAAFFNFLLHPINIHRLIANLCMGGSVAGAYAAYKFLTTDDPEKKAHYDWMGYIGNFIAVLALLPLPFAGYYLGFEIYGYNQQLGIYMMGGVLSWLFVMQAVLIGALFFAANYYLWVGMDRIEGAERYRGWIKFLLAMITLCVLVWGTPKSLILTSAEIDEIGGTNHPFLSIFGVMSAKNTAVNLIILTTFLSFLLYRRGNKVPTVKWAKAGMAMQALAFGVAAAIVIVIGIGGYVPSMWMESTKRVAMSPYQVLAVLACMFVVMPIDILMMKGAKEIGRIKWGQVSNRAQYTLFFLAVSFTWLMALMGFVRSSLRQHWHVYEVMKDGSADAFTPAIGYATIVCTVVVILFFLLVAFVVWVADLGVVKDTAHIAPQPAPVRGGRAIAWKAAAGVVGLVLFGWVLGYFFEETTKPASEADKKLAELRMNEKKMLAVYDVLDPEKGIYQIPIDQAMDMVASDASLLRPLVGGGGGDLSDLTPLQRGEALFQKTHACGQCHAVDGSKKLAPPLNARFGKPTKLADGTAPSFDDAYVRESVYKPTAKIAEGFQPLMPSFEGKLSDQDLADILEFLKSL
jgi:cytochrome bd ubiquinol oxidase subunit I